MEQLVEQYLDFGLMLDNFGKVWDGFKYTLLLSAVSGVLSLAWGLVLALLRQLPGRALAPVRWVAIGYIDVFRGIPLLLVVLIIFGSFGALTADGVLPEAIGIPRYFGLPDPFWYGALAITLTYGAYMAEVYRAGLEAVPPGQMEAARSLGMSHAQAMRYVITPQAVRLVIPPLLNDFIALMKDTSLISVIGLLEVVQVGRDIQAVEFNSSALTLGALMFLAVTIPLARLVDWLIARQKRLTGRGGDRDEDAADMEPPPATGMAGGVS
jgi:polar amino acid transport system permease protein